MTIKSGLKVLLGAAIVCAPTLAGAQGASQPAGINGPEQAVGAPVAAAQPLPGDPDYVEPEAPVRETAAQEQETIKISAPRYQRIHEARMPGSPNRGNPMRAFPGELPEKNAFNTPFDLEGIVLEDARESQAMPTIQGRPATPDTLNP